MVFKIGGLQLVLVEIVISLEILFASKKAQIEKAVFVQTPIAARVDFENMSTG